MNTTWNSRRMVPTVRAGVLALASETKAGWYESVSHRINGWGIVTKEPHRIACVKGDDLVFFAPEGSSFDEPIPLSPVEHAQALIVASAWASAHDDVPPFDAGKTVRIVVDAFATCDDGDSPMYASFCVNSGFLRKLEGLREVCKMHDLTEARIAGSPDWAPGEIEKQLRLQNGELVILPEGAFWFTDYPKHGGYQIETRGADLAQVREALENAQDGGVVFLTDDAEIRAEVDYQCGDCPNCLATVHYDDWIPVNEEPNLMGCPRCKKACSIESVYPSVTDEPAEASTA